MDGRTASEVAEVSADMFAAVGRMKDCEGERGGVAELKRCDAKDVENSEKEPAVASLEPPSSSYP